MAWYHLTDPDLIDSPALLVSPDGVQQNIRQTLVLAGQSLPRSEPGRVNGPAQRLRPHVKTHKMRAVTDLLLAAGIQQFKCATLSEARMVAEAGGPDVLLAYPVVGPKAHRLRALVEAFPGTRFSGLVDSTEGATYLAAAFAHYRLAVWIDLNVGMNRTGILPDEAASLIGQVLALPTLTIAGLHAYDGHIHDPDLATRTHRADVVFGQVKAVQQQINKQYGLTLPMIVGGTPTFPIHARRPDPLLCLSPGTFVFWDEGYRQMLPDLPYQIAAILMTRVISIIDAHRLCLDLGHKSVAAENPLPRVVFPDQPEAVPVAQSEEHLVVCVPDTSLHRPGDVWYAIPSHICPTINLYASAFVVTDHQPAGEWAVTARGH